MIQLYIYMCICIYIFFFFTFFSLKGYYYIIGIILYYIILYYIILYYIKGTEYSSLCYTIDPCWLSTTFLTLKFDLTWYTHGWFFPNSSAVKSLPAKQETQIRSLGTENPLGKGMATHSSILAWRIPWAEEPGGLPSIGSQRVGHDWSNLACMHACTHGCGEPTHTKSILISNEKGQSKSDNG